MRRIYTTTLFCIIFISTAFCQVDTVFVNRMVSKLKKFSEQHTTEKAYLQFNKPYYAAGDTLYFKAYVTTGDQHQLSNLSGILHVDFINAADHIEKNILVQLVNGLGWGDLALSDSLPKGNYRIRAYTQYMQAGDYFDQQLAISSLKNNVVYENASSVRQSAAPDVQFFPEGGNLVTDIRSKIAFKAIGTDGLSADVKGIVTDNNNKIITSFTSTHLGMGTFAILPEEGKLYRVKYKMKDSVQHVINLPAAISKGAALSVSVRNPERVAINIVANPAFFKENVNKNILLTVYSGGQLTYVRSKLDSHELDLYLPVAKFKTGIARFTLFSPNGTPLCERLSFIQNPADNLNLQVSTDKAGYSKREKVQVNVDGKDIPNISRGHFSVAVIDESKLSNAGYHNSISSYLLLTSELKGFIEQPEYYFDNKTDEARADLDALMLTQGYRKFTWKQLLTDTITPDNLVAERSLSVSGTVMALSKKTPLSNATVTLIGALNGTALTTQTDNNGKFLFKGLLYNDSTKFVITATDLNGSTKTLITLDRPAPEATVASVAVPGYPAPDMQSYLQTSQRQAGDNSYVPLKGKLLEEVKINSYRSSNIMGPGHADQVIDMRKITTRGSLEDMLTGIVRGVTFRNGMPILQGFQTGYMTVVIDGAIQQAPNDSTMSASPFSGLNTVDIETVEILKYANASAYGMEGGNGIFIVTTKKGGASETEFQKATGMLSFNAAGLHHAREFYSPKYEVSAAVSARTDLRSTIYWQPELITDSNGKASFSFYNADGMGSYKVIIEGIDETGRIGRSVYRYAVK